MRINLGGTCIYDDELGIGVPQPVIVAQPVFADLTSERKRLLEKVLPGIVGISLTSALMNGMAYADAGARLVAKEQSIIHTLQTIAVPASIAIAIWGLIESVVLNNPHGKKKLWESLWLLIGIKFIPDIWMTIGS